MRMSRSIAAVAAAWAFWAGPAQGSVIVLGGGQAAACSRAAFAGERSLWSQGLCTLALEQELLDDRDRAGTFVNRGVMKLRSGALRRAQLDFEMALRLQASLGEAHVNLGAAHIGQGRFGEGLKNTDRGLELGTLEPAKAYFNRALAHEGLGDLKAAYFDFLKAQELEPEWEAPKRQLQRFSVSRRSGS